jgi:hypothetical protein
LVDGRSVDMGLTIRARFSPPVPARLPPRRRSPQRSGQPVRVGGAE